MNSSTNTAISQKRINYLWLFIGIIVFFLITSTATLTLSRYAYGCDQVFYRGMEYYDQGLKPVSDLAFSHVTSKYFLHLPRYIPSLIYTKYPFQFKMIIPSGWMHIISGFVLSLLFLIGLKVAGLLKRRTQRSSQHYWFKLYSILRWIYIIFAVLVPIVEIISLFQLIDIQLLWILKFSYPGVYLLLSILPASAIVSRLPLLSVTKGEAELEIIGTEQKQPSPLVLKPSSKVIYAAVSTVSLIAIGFLVTPWIKNIFERGNDTIQLTNGVEPQEIFQITKPELHSFLADPVTLNPFSATQQQSRTVIGFLDIPIMTFITHGEYISTYQRVQTIAEMLNLAYKLAPLKGSDLVIRGYYESPFILLKVYGGIDPIPILEVYEEEAASYSENSDIGVTVQLLSRYWVGLLSILLGTNDEKIEGYQVGNSAMKSFQFLRKASLKDKSGANGQFSIPADIKQQIYGLISAVPSDIPKHSKKK